jgi:hypothetical protein
MTTRFMLIVAVAIMIGPSLVYGSSACMTESEAHTKFPKAHLYWHVSEHCWDGSPPRHASHTLATVPVQSPRPALAPVPSQPKIVGSGIDGGRVTGAQCRYVLCE